MGVLAQIADAGLTAKLEKALKQHANDPSAIQILRGVIDRTGIRSSELIQRIGDLTRAGVLKPRLFIKLTPIHDALAALAPHRRAPCAPPVRADLAAPRGPGDPALLRLGTDYPVPVESLFPREHTQGRRLFNYLLAHPVTRRELCEAGKKGGWSVSSAKLWWARLQSPQMVRAGWLLDIDPKTRKGQVVQLVATWDWRKGAAV